MFWLRLAGISAIAVALALTLGPREPAQFGPVQVDMTDDPAAWLAQREAGIRPEVASYLTWASKPGQQTNLAIVYIHGFSASPAELRPLPENLAASLGANILGIRLTGHGQDGAAMAQATVQDWWRDVAAALQIGRLIGRRVVVIGMSTGATLVAEAARDPQLGPRIDAAVLIAPNFALKNRWQWVLELPFIRQILALAGDPVRCFQPRNPAHAAGWTTCYPVAATLPLAALLRHARKGSYRDARMPALFIWSDADRVLDHSASRKVMQGWGGPASLMTVETGPNDDPDAHVIAGDTLSPDLSARLTRDIADWIGSALK